MEQFRGWVFQLSFFDKYRYACEKRRGVAVTTNDRLVQRATWCLHPEQNPPKCPHSLTTWLSSPLYSFWGGPGGSKAWESSSREDRLAVPWVSQHCDRPGVSQVGGQSRPLMVINVRPGWVQQLPVSHRVPAINWSHSVSKLRQFWVNSSSTSISQVAKYFYINWLML